MYQLGLVNLLHRVWNTHSEALWQILFPVPNSEQNILSAHMYPSAAVPGIFTGVQPSQNQRHEYVTKGKMK